MSTALEDTGERMIPEHHKGKNIYGAHLGRYRAGLSLVQNKVVLDIACGSGYGSKLMAETAKKVFAVDIDKKTIEYAQEHFADLKINYLVGSGEAIPLEDNSVDAVVSYETIEHIKNYKKFLSEVKRVLKPGGVLLLSTPNDKEYSEDNHFHLHEFEYEELKKLVEQYFKYHEDYFQTLWLYSTILPLDSQAKEWDKAIPTIQTTPVKPEDCIYFFLVCSDKEISAHINPVGVIGEHYRLREIQATNLKNHAKHRALMDAKEKLMRVEKENQGLKAQVEFVNKSAILRLIRKLHKFYVNNLRKV